jgi:hypothetical protein
VPSVLLDTGPLVALFKRNDTHQTRAAAWLKNHRGPLLTTQAVITEAWHLLSEPARLPLVRFVNTACEVHELSRQGQVRTLATLERYADQRMDYADATLVVLSDVLHVTSIATIDVKDFSAYRLANGKALKLVF